MNTQYPFTPPPELVQQWGTASPCKCDNTHWAYEQFIAAEAAKWAADQELEACCWWLCVEADGVAAQYLRAARRSKPPSLKEDALAALHGIDDQGPTPEQVVTIRRALEALPNDANPTSQEDYDRD
jgi:hypothetical protein